MVIDLRRFAENALAFPVLDDAMLRRLAGFGDIQQLTGTAARRRSGGNVAEMDVVLDGSIDLMAIRDDGHHLIARLSRGQFTGDLSLVSDVASSTTGRGELASSVLRLGGGALRRLLIAEPDLGEIVVKALIYRSIALSRTTSGLSLELKR